FPVSSPRGPPAMPMVCPQCRDSFEQMLQCPNCGVRLLFQSAVRRSPFSFSRQEGSWQATPWGRLVVRLLLAQGLDYALQKFCTAGLLVASEDGAKTVQATLAGLILLQALQAVGVLAGAMLAGAGKQQGALFGALLGVWNGVLFIVIQQASGEALTPI